MKLKELYKRPCFAACADCGQHGAIIFEDGKQSEPIVSIEEGKKMVHELVNTGKLTPENADRIEDHLACSDLLPTEREALALTLLSMTCDVMEDVVKAERAHWN